MKIRSLILLITLLFLHFIVSGEIIVRQNKDGSISLTNSPGVYRNSGKPAVKYLSSSFSTSVPYNYHMKIKDLSKKHGVSESLIIAVARAESGFNTFAKSKKGAVGIMQLMKKTAKGYGVSNRYNADQNLEGGVKHLKYLLNRYNNDLTKTLAAYNAGEEAVKKYKGVPPYRETKNYIRKVRKFMGLPVSSTSYARAKTKIFKYKTQNGRLMISDSPPVNSDTKVEIFD
ncbi:MAG: lytic transglycosylase domain-containing protein [Acidobacteriota bacterium]